jgi:hypothetical protein
MAGGTLEPVVTVAGIIVATSVTIYQIRRAISPIRLSVKHDLETLKLAKELNLPTKALEDEIAQKLATLEPDYKSPHWRLTEDVVISLVSGLFMSIIFGYWTYHLNKGGFSWWSVLTGYLAVVGLMIPTLELRRQQRKDAVAAEREKTQQNA